RRRWAFGYDTLMAVFRRQLVRGYRKLVDSLPEAAFDTDGDAPFTVPLSSLMEEPAAAIESLLLSIYDDDVFRHDIFKRLRERFATNLVIASGFLPGTNPHDVFDRLVMPTRHKSDNGTELAALYLSGTPFEDVFDHPVTFSVPDAMRFEHCHVIGGTGHGKTQLLQRMIHADFASARDDGRSVIVIDSQGDLIQKLVRLDLFDPDDPSSLADRLVVIDPADVEYPPSLNLFDAPVQRLEEYRPADRERALNGLIELYETFFGALLGAELTQKQGVIFRYLARLMLAIPGATIHTLMQLMEDSRPFKEHMGNLDGSARHFFATEFSHPSFAATKKQILKRLWGVLSTPAFERMFAQRANKLDLFEAMNEGKIVFINTAKDLLKTEGSALFGRFFVAMIAQAALERSAIPEHKRTPTLLYVDEAQEYFDDTIETILSQARKYKVGITAAHQTLDQLSPRLRAAFLSNTSCKCAGGVSAKDARALASELHTTVEFIEGMRKRRERTEFAVWLKHRTPEALRLDVPLGFLERQPTLSEDAFDELIARNRIRYGGTLDDVLPFAPAEAPNTSPAPSAAALSPAQPPEVEGPPVRPREPVRRAAVEDRELGKGGPKHRYLQSLVKELAEQQGFRATIEAPLPDGVGQIDVLLAREGIAVAVEVSVSTPIEQERQNVRKCLDADFARVAVVLAKSRATSGRYRTAILETLSPEERDRVSLLAPEELPDFIAALAPVPPASESIVKGYRVRVQHTAVSPDEAKARRDQLAKLVARSLRRED
ncbi:MAG TPA: type IV secretion system DNA-binding domain-containing protein, partial [Croceibacterium sp.]